MDWGLKGKTALVTGASQGIGRVTAKLLALEGVRVVAVARRLELLVQLSEELKSAGGTPIVPLQADLSVDGEPERIAKEAGEILGRIDILMNATGRFRCYKRSVDRGDDVELLSHS